MRRKEWVAVVLAVGALGLAACGGGQEQQPPPEAPATTAPPPQPAEAGPTAALPPGVTQEMVTQGQQLYTGQANCFTCHGQDGRGTALGPDLTDNTWIHINSQEPLIPQLETVIRVGVAQPREFPAPMPPMGGVQLNEQQVHDLAVYTASLSGFGGQE